MNRKRQVFCEEYLKCFIPTKAARRAGYAHPHVMASRLMKVKEIQDYIKKRMEEKVMSADEVLLRLADIARADISEFVNENGIIDFSKVYVKGHLVKKVLHQRGKQSTIELHDSMNALNMLARHYALFTDRVKIDDWRSEIVELLKEGTIKPEQVINEFGRDLATELFISAGIPIGQSGEVEASSESGNSSSMA